MNHGPKWSKKCEERKKKCCCWVGALGRNPGAKIKTQMWTGAALSSSTVKSSWQTNTSLGHLDHLLLTDFCHLVNQSALDAYVALLFMAICPDVSCDPRSGGLSFLVTVNPNKCYINITELSIPIHLRVRLCILTFDCQHRCESQLTFFIFFFFFFQHISHLSQYTSPCKI